MGGYDINTIHFLKAFVCLFNVCGCFVWTRTYVRHVCLVLEETRSILSSGTRVTNGSGLPHYCWEANLGSL